MQINCNFTRPVYMWPSEQEHNLFAYKLKYILLPQLIATLNIYACPLPILANVNWSAFPGCFNSCWLCNSTTGEMTPMDGSSFALGTWYGSHCLGLVVEYWTFVVHVKVIVILNSAICVIVLLCFNLCHHTPHTLHSSHSTPYIRWSNTLMNSMKTFVKTGEISHYPFSRLVVQKLLDN